MSTVQITIAVMSGPEDGRIANFESDDSGVSHVMIGRGAENDITFETDIAMSRVHARVSYAQGNLTLTDMNSRNGVFLEGLNMLYEDQRVLGEVHLNPRHPFRVGQTWLSASVALFEDADEEPSQ